MDGGAALAARTGRTMVESICAENNFSFFDYDVVPNSRSRKSRFLNRGRSIKSPPAQFPFVHPSRTALDDGCAVILRMILSEKSATFRDYGNQPKRWRTSSAPVPSAASFAAAISRRIGAMPQFVHRVIFSRGT